LRQRGRVERGEKVKETDGRLRDNGGEMGRDSGRQRADNKQVYQGSTHRGRHRAVETQGEPRGKTQRVKD
jgi:hypothetical protein